MEHRCKIQYATDYVNVVRRRKMTGCHDTNSKDAARGGLPMIRLCRIQHRVAARHITHRTVAAARPPINGPLPGYRIFGAGVSFGPGWAIIK